MQSHIDHLVVAAHTLDQGVQWCEATLGITPAPGGEHAQFGTHNRLFKIATPQYPLAYFEIIAINPQGKRTGSPSAKRWFDLDDAALQAAIQTEPRLVHFVANTDDIQSARRALKTLEIDRGPALKATRHSRRGLLEWQITVREDGQRLFNGTLPSLIQWGAVDATEPLRLHPRNSLPRSGVSLRSLHISHPSSAKIQAALQSIDLQGIAVDSGEPNLVATLNTPKGLVVLESLGL
jgi:hypothetical protein